MSWLRRLSPWSLRELVPPRGCGTWRHAWGEHHYCCTGRRMNWPSNYGRNGDRQSGLVVGLVYGPTAGVMVGPGSALVSSATWAMTLTSAQLQRRGETPACLLPFLDDARQREILRTVGPVYQFRNVRLQNRLPRAENTPQRVPVSPGYATPRG